MKMSACVGGTAVSRPRPQRARQRVLMAVAAALTVIALGASAIVLWPKDSGNEGSATVSPQVFLIRDGKFDCSTLYDQVSLSQLADSGLAAIPGFDSLGDKPITAPDGRTVCGKASGNEHGTDVTFHLVSQPSTCGPDDNGNWRHNQKLRTPNGAVLGIASMLSDSSLGCLFIAGMRNEENTTDEADTAIARRVQEISEGIAPLVADAVHTDASKSATADTAFDGHTETSGITPTFIRNGHYDCRAYADTTTMQQAGEIGLTRPILPAPRDESNHSENSGQTIFTCGFTKDFTDADILTAADPNTAVCTKHSGVPLEAMPGWSYFVDARGVQQPTRGRDQGQVSMNLLHRDPEMGCIIVRSYSGNGTLADISRSIAELSSFAGSIDALTTDVGKVSDNQISNHDGQDSKQEEE